MSTHTTKAKKLLRSKTVRITTSCLFAALIVTSMIPTLSLAQIAAQVRAATQPAGAAEKPATPAGTSATKTASTPSKPTAAPTKSASTPASTQANPAPAPAPQTRTAARSSRTATELWVDGSTGSDTNDGSAAKALKTLPRALELQKANPSISVIHLTGTHALSATQTIPLGVMLRIGDAGATITGTGNAINGIVLKSGAALSGTGTLSMSGFKTALIAEKGSSITDGTYKFIGNGFSDGRGISLGGLVKGSAGKNKLTITADDVCNSNFYESSVVFENCTINVVSQNRTWFDARNLTLKNASLTVEGFGMSFYVNKLTMLDSEFIINKRGWRHSTGLAIQGASNIVSSRIVANAGSTAGISVGVSKGDVVVTDSTLELNNAGTGGLNVNTGRVVLTNSTIKGNGQQYGALFGAQAKGTIELGPNCLVESPAAKDSDSGAGETRQNYIVLGGSHLVKYAPDYNSSLGSTTPTNGPANGNEPLSLFTLADAAPTTLTPLNKNGVAYEYHVDKASSDSKKHVWVPAAKLTFVLNAPDAAQTVDASYADGSSANQIALAMRGYALKDATAVGGGSVALPSNPFAAGYNFVGWFYKDATGAEKPFSADVAVTTDTTVYAKWQADASSYAIKYHNDQNPEVTYLASSSRADRSAKVLTKDEIATASPKFIPEGKTFKGWSTQPQGAGTKVAEGSTVTIKPGVTTLDLYAVWEEQQVSVKFSANGGVFAPDSVFKTHPSAFDIQHDANGGEVAVVKKQAKVADKIKLSALLSSLDSSLTHKTPGILGVTQQANDAVYTKLATRPYYVLQSKKVSLGSIFGISLGEAYHYWFVDAKGTTEAKIGDDITLTKDYTFYLNWAADPAIERIHEKLALPADIMVGNDTQHTSIYPVVAGQTIDFTGTIEASVVKAQMRGIEKKFPNTTDYSKVALSDMSSSFKAIFTLPEGMEFPSTLTAADIKTEGFADTFSVSKVEVNGKTVSITLTLKDGIATYKDLQAAVIDKLADTMKLTLPGVKLSNTLAAGTKATVKGTLDGSFKACATNDAGTRKLFSFEWNGVQKPEGKDFTAASVDDGILFTVAVPTPLVSDLPGDILVGTNTTHTEPLKLAQGEHFDLTGALLAQTIRDQMKAIEARYPGTAHDQIALSSLRFSFVATMTVPDGMTLPKNLTKDSIKLLDFGPGFVVSDVSVSGKTVTVRFALANPAAIKTYADLKAVVDAAGAADGWMKLTVPAVELDHEATVGKPHTIVGTVVGDFSAVATSQAGTRKLFSFVWNAVQWPDGKDSSASDEKTIQLTVVPTKAADPHPVPPSAPKPTPKPSPKAAATRAVPKTGDLTNISTSLVGTLMGSGMLAASWFVAHRRNKKADKR